MSAIDEMKTALDADKSGYGQSNVGISSGPERTALFINSKSISDAKHCTDQVRAEEEHQIPESYVENVCLPTMVSSWYTHTIWDAQVTGQEDTSLGAQCGKSGDEND